MNARAQALLLGHLSKETSKLSAFGITQGRAHIVLVLPGNATESFELGVTGCREAQCVGSTINGRWAAFHEPLLLEPVKQEHKPARKRAEEFRQGSLRHIRLMQQIPEYSRFGRCQAERRQTVRKPRRGMRTDLSEEEGGACPAGFLGHSY
jgi:hypothetical protein